MKIPLISIIVPCYNVEQYLPQCVESIINQTYSNWELILVDDGSKDSTGRICDDYARKDSRIKVLHKSNGGLVSARNAGYNAVTGKWHTYIDGDDWIDTDTCERLVEFISKNQDVDVFFWKCVQELDGKSIAGKWEWPCPELSRIYEGDECVELSRHTLVYKSGIATAYCKLVRTDYARKNGIRHDDRLRQGAEGVEFSLRCFYFAKKTMFINAYYNHYRYNPNSISKTVDEKNTVYLTDCFHVIAENLVRFGVWNRFSPALYQRIVYVLIAIAMGTYFHPGNREGIWSKHRKYRDVISSEKLYKDAVRLTDTNGMGNSRKIALAIIRMRLYFLLAPISWLKLYYLKKGKFNY